MNIRGYGRSCVGASPVGVAASGYRFRRLLDRHHHSYLLVAPALAPLHELRLLEKMTNEIESSLGQDHESLDRLLTELETALTRNDNAHAFELLDLFWARLAVHIRAENLQLFPAIANAPATLFRGEDGLPTLEQAHNLLARLRSDHDFFMKELARMINVMREVAARTRPPNEADLRASLLGVRKRLEIHNRLEENQAYLWPALLFNDKTVLELNIRIQREIEKLPPRFV